VLYEPGRAKFNEDPELYVDVQFPVLPFYKRVWVALRYVFGNQEAWTEHCLTDESIVSLGKIIQKYRMVKALRHAIRANKARKEAERGGQASNCVDRTT
jgi:hypothetical protein